MINKIDQAISNLKNIINIYDGKSINDKILYIKSISKLTLKNEQQLINYHELLMFIATNPENKEIKKLVDEEFIRIANFIKTNSKIKDKCADTSLPFTKIYTQFSHDLLLWMNENKQCKVGVESFDKSGVELNKLLRLTLPTLEQDLTTAGMNNEDLLSALNIEKKQQLTFLINEFSKLNEIPLIKDYLWESLQLNLEIESIDKRFSRAFNKIPQHSIFYQAEMLKKFDHFALMNQALPPARTLNTEQTNELASVIKKSLVLTRRETDPSTFMDKSSLRLYDLERGISIAIFGMNAKRQMPLQSYIGYALFKNGFPVAYGGSWVLGKTAWFGLNIFDAFRGGESGYIMCQLLRVYKQVFELDYIEVEPYQYGYNNPDGIKSGAFWFYYRYGFRPVDKTLYNIAENEASKIKNKTGYRTNEKTLLKFTESNIGLKFNETKPHLLTEITAKVREMIATEFKGNRILAIDFCLNELTKKLNNATFNQNENTALIETALIAHALKITDKKRTILLENMIRLKFANPYEYNKVLSNFFDATKL